MSVFSDSPVLFDNSDSKKSRDDTRDTALASASKEHDSFFEDGREDSNGIPLQNKFDRFIFLTPKKSQATDYLRKKLSEPSKVEVHRFIHSGELGKRSDMENMLLYPKLDEFISQIFVKKVKNEQNNDSLAPETSPDKMLAEVTEPSQESNNISGQEVSSSKSSTNLLDSREKSIQDTSLVVPLPEQSIVERTEALGVRQNEVIANIPGLLKSSLDVVHMCEGISRKASDLILDFQRGKYFRSHKLIFEDIVMEQFAPIKPDHTSQDEDTQIPKDSLESLLLSTKLPPKLEILANKFNELDQILMNCELMRKVPLFSTVVQAMMVTFQTRLTEEDLGRMLTVAPELIKVCDHVDRMTEVFGITVYRLANNLNLQDRQETFRIKLAKYVKHYCEVAMIKFGEINNETYATLNIVLAAELPNIKDKKSEVLQVVECGITTGGKFQTTNYRCEERSNQNIFERGC